MSRATLTSISGVGGKGPACFLVQTDGKRLMLDLGLGPQPGRLPDVEGVGNVDALIISHSHKDHAAGLSLLNRIGNPPIYATEIVSARLPLPAETRPIPLCGETSVAGIRLRTGRASHAPGGVWLWIGAGDSLLYTGDYTIESILYAYDPPPGAATVLLDASYGADDAPLSEGEDKLAAFLTSPCLVLPVPGDGRGPEIALHLWRKGIRSMRLDEPMRQSILRLAALERATLCPNTEPDLLAIARNAKAPSEPEGIVMVTSADGTSGESARLIAEWESNPNVAFVFTGYVPPDTPAQRLTASGRGRYIRWNVHPRLRDNIALVRSIGARSVVPAFCEFSKIEPAQPNFAPARLAFEKQVSL